MSVNATPLELLREDQESIDSAETALNEIRQLALHRFRTQYRARLTDEELEELASLCDAEEGDNHCVRCAAWAELCDRRNET